jgi:hypothetical protein
MKFSWKSKTAQERGFDYVTELNIH